MSLAFLTLITANFIYKKHNKLACIEVWGVFKNVKIQSKKADSYRDSK